MQVAAPHAKPIFDKSVAIAYGGVAIAVAFIAALTMGMIDAPSQHDSMTASNTDAATKNLSIAAAENGVTSVR